MRRYYVWLQRKDVVEMVPYLIAIGNVLWRVLEYAGRTIVKKKKNGRFGEESRASLTFDRVTTAAHRI